MLHYTIIPVTPYQQNCCLIWDDATQTAVLTDPGGEPDRLLDAVAQRGLSLQALWLTHGHLDHVGAAPELRRRTGVPVIGPHPADRYWLDALPQQSVKFGFAPCEAFVPDRWLDDGDMLELGAHRFTVRHTPGHTPGHVVIHQAEIQRCWVGDVLFAGSIGRTDFPGGDHAQLLASIRERLWPMGDATVFIPGHGPESNFGEERRTNPFVAGRAG